MTRSLAEWVKALSKKTEQSDAEEILRIAGVREDGDASILGRLGDLGVGAGESISFFGVAPLGEPIYICVRDTVVALREDEAQLIHIDDGGLK